MTREVIITWDGVLKDARHLAARFSASHQFKGIVAIARGGLIPAAIVARELDIRVVHTMCIAGYSNMSQNGDLDLISIPDSQVYAAQGEGWLIIDDLVDTGRTGNLVRRHFPRATYATLYAKEIAKPDYWETQFLQNDWIHFPWDVEYKFAKPIRGEG